MYRDVVGSCRTTEVYLKIKSFQINLLLTQIKLKKKFFQLFVFVRAQRCCLSTQLFGSFLAFIIDVDLKRISCSQAHGITWLRKTKHVQPNSWNNMTKENQTREATVSFTVRTFGRNIPKQCTKQCTVIPYDIVSIKLII